MTTWTQSAFEVVANFVNRRSGLSLATCQESAEQGMRRAMARAGIDDPLQYVDRLDTDERALDDLLTELTVGETYFFREPAHFQFIQHRIVPEILRQRGSDHALRIWSAACASGEEAYSLAILFEQIGLGDRIHLTATDISRAALTKARHGLYSAWSLRGDGACAAFPALTPVGKNYRLDENTRRRAQFSALNLALDVYPSFATGIWGMDLILCRNVLIYFDKETVRRTAQRLYQSLTVGGWLIAASADPPLWDHAPFEVIADLDGLFYRKPGGETVRPVKTTPALAVEEVRRAAVSEPEATDAAVPRLMVPARAEGGLDSARLALRDGVDTGSVQGSVDSEDGAEAAARQVRVLANLDPAAARTLCAQATGQFPLSAELHFLNAMLWFDRGRNDEAANAMRRVLYLDRTLAIAHFTLGAILRQRGDAAGACRAYRNARNLCGCRPADEPVPFGEGETAGRLAEIAAAELALLDLPE
ncbi:MAG: hypothetical protein HYX68_13445 [Planctomycetes bacterium]|nr:hypothetical protein [Planctomycetota bacterium]